MGSRILRFLAPTCISLRNGWGVRSRHIVETLWISGIYFLLGQLSLFVAFRQDHVSPIWFPSGYALAVLMLVGFRTCPAIFLGAFGVYLTTALTSLAAFTLAVGNVVEALFGYVLLNWANIQIRSSRTRDLIAYLGLAGGVSTTVSASVGTTILFFCNIIPANEYPQVWLIWWFAGSISNCLIGPLIFVWFSEKLRSLSKTEWAEGMAALLCLMGISWITFGWKASSGNGFWPLSLLYFPCLIWLGLRFGQRGGTLGLLAVSLLANLATVSGYGPFVHRPIIESLFHLNLFLVVLIVCILLLTWVMTERDRMSAELCQKQRLLLKAEEIAHLGCWESDPTGSNIIWSDHMYQIFGLSADEFDGRIETIIKQVVHPRERSRVQRQWQSIFGKRQQGSIEFRIIRSDGQVRRIFCQSHLVRDERGDVVHHVGIAQDITDRKNAEEALRHSEAMLVKAEEIANIGSWEVDTSGMHTSWSDQLYRIFGIHPGHYDETMASLLTRIIHPEDRERFEKAWKKMFTTGEIQPLEYRILHPRGEERTIYTQGQPIRKEMGKIVRFVGTAQDITDRKQIDQALRESESRYRLLAENATDMISRHNLAGIFLYASPACRTLFGYKPEEMVGRSAYDFIHPEDTVKITEFLGLLHSTGSAPGTTYRVRCKDHSYLWVEVQVRLIENDLTNENEILCCTRDVSERMRLEEQFRQAQKMEAVGRLAGGVAHDFNNLLTIINGYSELLLSVSDENDPNRAIIEEIHNAGNRAASLTRQLLAFSRKQVLVMKYLNLNETITGMEKLLRRLIGEDIQLTTRLEAQLPSVKADPSQLEQIVMNLAVNSRDAMPNGGEIIIESRSIEYREEIDCGECTIPPGLYAVLRITDNGCGMDEATKKHLFEPFFTTKQLGKGTGLGLATVYGIVRQFGGYVTVESKMEEGTSFEIYLPSAIESESQNITQSLKPTDTKGRETILLVEDDDGVRSFGSQVLRGKGYQVLQASNGMEAIRIFEYQSNQIDLLVSDVVMPRMNGRELADRLIALRPDLKVLFLSGYTDDAILKHGVLDHNVPFLHKPFTPAQLATKVREVLDRIKIPGSYSPLEIPASQKETVELSETIG